ncbi:MAG TPA: hypothetical protein VHO90_06445 [Bacteroidales bacterium]|nr:hypothetical protein [Bacteroidales bacterium]
MHKLSLDIVAGSVGSYVFASRVMDFAVSPWFALLLALSVWTIYLADHFLDSRKLSSRKYLIFRRYRGLMILLLVIVVLTDIVLIIKVADVALLLHGSVLGLILVAYLALQHFLPLQKRIFFPKEVLIALVYTAAVWLYPVARSGELSWLQLLLMLVHFMLVLMNVVVFSYFEREDDMRDYRISLFSGLPDASFRRFIVAWGTTIMLASFAILTVTFYIPAIVPALIAFLYCLEIHYRHTPFVNNYYAEATDGAFLLFLIFV